MNVFVRIFDFDLNAGKNHRFFKELSVSRVLVSRFRWNSARWIFEASSFTSCHMTPMWWLIGGQITTFCMHTAMRSCDPSIDRFLATDYDERYLNPLWWVIGGHMTSKGVKWQIRGLNNKWFYFLIFWFDLVSGCFRFWSKICRVGLVWSYFVETLKPHRFRGNPEIALFL